MTLTCTHRSLLLVVGWSIAGYFAYKAATAKIENKVYNPFEILDISTVSTMLKYRLARLIFQ